MTAEEILVAQIAACGASGNAVLADAECKAAYSRSHNFVIDLNTLNAAIASERTKKIFQMGIKEYQFAILAASLGMYRHGFGALRLAMELCLSAIEFSANEQKLRAWMRGEVDITWQAIINDETGVFSKNFVKVFCDDMAALAPQYRTLSGKLYRECSEYVHGNMSTHQALPDTIAFTKETFLLWCDKVSALRLSILFAFTARFADDFSDAQKDAIKGIVLDGLGHLEPIRLRFGGPVGG